MAAVSVFTKVRDRPPRSVCKKKHGVRYVCENVFYESFPRVRRHSTQRDRARHRVTTDLNAVDRI